MLVETLRTGLIFPKMINLRGHMPRFTLKMNISASISLETLYMCVETLRSCLGKMSPVRRVSTHIYGTSKDIDGKTLIFQLNLGM